MEFEKYSATNLKSTDTKENLPDPTGVLRGFKAIGYSIEEALSDLIDNSIDAKAKNIVIEFGRSDEDLLFIRVIDDGEGIHTHKQSAPFQQEQC